MNRSKIGLLIGIVALVGVFFYFDLGSYLTLDYIKSKQGDFQAFYEHNTLVTIAAFSAIYIISTALSFPGATVLTLAGGAFFGFSAGLVIVSFASTIGATLAFLMSRYLLRDTVQKKFGEKLSALNDGIEKDGAFYLFSLRLVPVVPFFLINLGMGLTPLKTWQFYVVSQIGMIFGTAVYVNAGTELGKIDSLSGLLSPALLASFVLLGVLPILSKKILEFIKRSRQPA